jgi:tetratricopeptide (TPR) repeat protein
VTFRITQTATRQFRGASARSCHLHARWNGSILYLHLSIMAVDILPNGGGDAAPPDPLSSVPSLIIPITTTSDGLCIEMFPEEVRETSASMLLSVLQDEAMKSDAVRVWLQASQSYMAVKKPREALNVLRTACDTFAHYTDVRKEDRVLLLASTGIAHLAVTSDHHVVADTTGTSSVRAAKEKRDDEELQSADGRFTQAMKVDTFCPMTWMGRGLLNVGTRRLDQAKFFFDTILKQCGPALPALLGMAAVHFIENRYELSQEFYGAAIQKYPDLSGASARLGFGLCCYKLGQMDRARAAISRALALDPEHVDAMVASALLSMAGLDASMAREFAAETNKINELLTMANYINDSHASVQNHLANHFFWTWKPVAGAVRVSQNSSILRAGKHIGETIAAHLEKGEQIRIGSKFVTTVVEVLQNDLGDDDEDVAYRIQHPWKEATISKFVYCDRRFPLVLCPHLFAFSLS